jgi:tetrahydromethanopterin S-methyltransferase subunit F
MLVSNILLASQLIGRDLHCGLENILYFSSTLTTVLVWNSLRDGVSPNYGFACILVTALVLVCHVF